MGEALQQEAEHLANSSHSGLGERRVPQGQQKSGDQLELAQQLGVLHCLAVEHNRHQLITLSKRWTIGIVWKTDDGPPFSGLSSKRKRELMLKNGILSLDF